MSEKERRLSPFTSPLSPWSIRNLVLSRAMIEDETPSIYESHSFFSDSAPHTIITLKKGQGFIFNQDLFATPYQQLRALAKERKIRAFSMSHAKAKGLSPKARSSSSSRSPSQPAQRRHTSYDPRPHFQARLLAKFDSAIDDDSMDVDSEPEKKEVALQEAALEELEGLEGLEGLEEELEEELDLEDFEGEYDEYRGIDGFSGFCKVKVEEIVVDPNDKSYLPCPEEEP